VYGLLRSPPIDTSPDFDVLVVCTGNIARSPMGEALLRAHLASRGAHAHVHSAGTLAWEGPATEPARFAMSERGLDISDHRSRPLTGALVAAADLILGMTRSHVWGVHAFDADADDRTFLVAELPRLGARVGPRRDGEAVRAWAARAAAERAPGSVAGRGEEEVPDPFGERPAVYEATADRLDRATRAIAELLVPDP
jgi:protein-tyrosine phosphatase